MRAAYMCSSGADASIFTLKATVAGIASVSRLSMADWVAAVSCALIADLTAAILVAASFVAFAAYSTLDATVVSWLVPCSPRAAASEKRWTRTSAVRPALFSPRALRSARASLGFSDISVRRPLAAGPCL